MGPDPLGKTILVVEDDANLRNLVAQVLQQDGYSVFCATGRVEIPRVLQRHHFDLVITDVIMPDFDGAEVMRAVKKYQPGAALIAMSGGGSYMTRDYCLRLTKLMGAVAVLEKPLRVDELLRAVDRVFNSSDTTPAR